ncbi:MAG: YhcH/YjgK/YiaL family protein [Mucinivorans sp.]
MILSNIKNAEFYYSLNPFFKLGIDFLRSHLDAPTGRYEIAGDDCFMMIVDGTKREPSEAKLEVHNKYIDIQVVLSGNETFGYRDRAACLVATGEFDVSSDIGFFDDQPSSYLDCLAGDMVIFFPADAHAPLVGQGSVHKVIIKVRA